MFSVVDYVLNATVLSPDGKYNVSLVAQWFHRIPHLDIRLNWVNSTFDPSDNEYLEALGILVAVPGFWLILTLLFFLIFFLCRCCDVNSKKKKKLTCCKCCLFMFTLITTAAIGVGFYGNYQSHEGLIEVQNSTAHLELQHLNWLRNKSQTVEILCDTGIESRLNSLSSSLVGPLVKNYSVVNVLSDHILAMKRNTTKCVNIMGDVNRKLASLDISYIPRTIKEGEQFRWPIVMAIFAFLVFICLILFCGICRHSRCLLILFSVLGLLSLVVCWVMTSLLLGSSVAGADFCMDPKPFLRKQYSSTGETILINYYLNCDLQDKNPLAPSIDDMRQNVVVLQSHIFEVSRICDEYCHERIVKDDINAVKSHLTKIEELLADIDEMSKCSHIHDEYINTMSYTCKDTLEGVALMLASTSATGLLLTLLVLCASHTWINIRKKRAVMGDTAEETDPFLPPTSASSTVSSANSKRMRDNFSTSSSSTRPRYSHTPPQTPHFPSSGPISTSTPTPINGRSVNREDQLSFLTPPPSYEQVGQHQPHHQQHPHPHPHHPQLHGQQHHQAVGPHYVADTDLMMRATQATKF